MALTVFNRRFRAISADVLSVERRFPVLKFGKFSEKFAYFFWIPSYGFRPAIIVAQVMAQE